MALSSSECINSRERITRVFCKVDTKKKHMAMLITLNLSIKQGLSGSGAICKKIIKELLVGNNCRSYDCWLDRR